MLSMVREARSLGLTTPVIFMGYYNPVRAYGEEKIIRDCRDAGVNGFILVDLPPEEALWFRELCRRDGYDSPSFYASISTFILRIYNHGNSAEIEDNG